VHDVGHGPALPLADRDPELVDDPAVGDREGRDAVVPSRARRDDAADAASIPTGT